MIKALGYGDNTIIENQGLIDTSPQLKSQCPYHSEVSGGRDNYKIAVVYQLINEEDKIIEGAYSCTAAGDDSRLKCDLIRKCINDTLSPIDFIIDPLELHNQIDQINLNNLNNLN